MATITWKTKQKALVKSSGGDLAVTIKKNAGGLSYKLLNSDGVTIYSGATVADCKEYAEKYYKNF